MAELGSTGSDDDNNIEDEDDRSSTSSNEDNQKKHINGKLNLKKEELINNNHHIDDVDDDELERLARINAEFNTNNLSEKPLKPKGENSILLFLFIMNLFRYITYISSNTS
jgi:hypothetical protein